VPEADTMHSMRVDLCSLLSGDVYRRRPLGTQACQGDWQDKRRAAHIRGRAARYVWLSIAAIVHPTTEPTDHGTPLTKLVECHFYDYSVHMCRTDADGSVRNINTSTMRRSYSILKVPCTILMMCHFDCCFVFSLYNVFTVVPSIL
jgi:hypothetical protein